MRRGGRAGRVLPGLGAAVLARYASLDRFHLPPDCHWCGIVDAVQAGRPVELTADAMHWFITDHDVFECSGRWTHDDPGRFVVTGDQYERV